MHDQIIIDGITYHRIELRMKKNGITDSCFVYTQTPINLDSMIQSTAFTIAEEAAEEALTKLITKKVKEFLNV